MKKILSLLAASACAGVLITLGVSQEVPVGSLRGSVEMAENNRPLANVLVVLSPITPADDTYEKQNWHIRTRPDGTFSFNQLPSGDYRIEVVAKQHNLRSKAVEIQEGGQAPVHLELTPREPTLQLYASQKVIAPNAEPKLELSGFTPDDRFKIEVRKLKVDEVVQKGGVQEALEPVARQHKSLNAKDLDSFSERMSSSSFKIVKKDSEGAFVSPLTVPKLEEGLYFVTVSGANLSASVSLNVSRVGLVTKSFGQSALCFVTDIDTGRPISHAALSMGGPSGLRPIGFTDSSGLANLTLKSQEKASMILAEADHSIAVSDVSLGQDSTEEGGSAIDPNIRIFTYADRPVYRPGDTVQFKSIVRNLSGDDLKLPRKGVANVQLLDDQQNVLEVRQLPLTLHGTLDGSFTTSSEAKPGVYQIQVKALGGDSSYYVNLAAYRKPDYSISVTPQKKRYSLGEEASATVECQYFFGGPVIGAKVTANVYRSPEWGFDNSSDEEAAPDDEGFSGGEFVQKIEAVTDGTGKAIIPFSTAVTNTSDGVDTDYRYSIQATVSGSSGHSFDGSGSVLVTRGDLQLDLSTDLNFLEVNQRAELTIHAKSFDSASSPLGGVPVRVIMDREVFTARTVVYEPIQTVSITTDKSGSAQIPIVAAAEGDIRIKAVASDSSGRSIESETNVYVSGSPQLYNDSDTKLDIRLDRKRYSAGDLAKALITTNKPGGVALITVESDTIKSHFLVDLNEGSAVVQILVDKSMTPNAYVTASYVVARTYSENSANLTAARKEKKLTVTVTPDLKKSLPGSSVGFEVKTTDSQGRGVAANVSFGLVDESIYAIKKDTTDIARDLYPRKDNLVRTSYSFPEIYLDGGDKAGGSVPVRRRFLDTAAWYPNIETDDHGLAHVKVKIPDNLTSWRATTVAATDETSVGMGISNVIASKPLMIRITAPGFLVENDRQTFGADITNDSGEPLHVDFSTIANQLLLGKYNPDSLTLANGETKTVELPVIALSSGPATLTVIVKSDKGFSDAVESSFLVHSHGRLVQTDLSGAVNKTKKFTLNLGYDHDLRSGSLLVSMSPTIASSVLQSLDSLVQFPYGCVEQTLSRFLPAVKVVSTIKGTALETATLDKRADKIAIDGFARLQKMQHKDGGWGWWTYDDSDPFMTAWVLDGLRTAKACGKSSPPEIDIAGALHWTVARLKQPFKGDTVSEKLYLLLVAEEYGRMPQAGSVLAGMDLHHADLGELSLAALDAHQVGSAEIEKDALTRITSELRDDGVARPGKHFFWNDDEELALALRALVALEPNSTQIPTLIARLEGERRLEGWGSTRATTLSTVALCDYIVEHPQTINPSEATVSLNGRVLRKINLNPASTDVRNYQLEIPITQLQNADNELQVDDPNGQPYVNVSLRAYEVQPELGQVLSDSSLSVQRAYYLMEPGRIQDGSMSLLRSKTPTTVFKSGDIVRCVVTVHCERPIDYLFIEDPLPSNCRVTDREDPMDGEAWSYWWSDITIMDDRVALFARQMEAGTHELEYTMRAEGTGTSTALPTHAEDMYFPSINASGAESKIQVNP